MKKLRILVVGSLFLSFSLAAHAATLSDNQIKSIIMLLRSFGASSAERVSVEDALRGIVPVQACTPLMRTLVLGSSGEEVQKLQEFLSRKGYFTLQPTGYYGRVTSAAVRAFQKANGLEQVGNVGPRTLEKIQAQSCDGVVLGISKVNNYIPRSRGGGGGSSQTQEPMPTREIPPTSTSTPTDTTPASITITAPLTGLPPGTKTTVLSAETNEAALCAYSSSDTGYESMTQFSETGALIHSSTLINLSDGTTYTYYLACKDSAGNVGGNASVTFTVANPPPPPPPEPPTPTTTLRFQTVVDVNVRPTPCNSGKPEKQAAGSVGTALSGPTQGCSYTWYNINFDYGADGWVVTDYLVPINISTPTTTLTFGIDVGIKTQTSVNVRERPNNQARILCVQPPGAVGYITAGPDKHGGYTWWKIDYLASCDGWTAEDFLDVGNF